MGLLVNFKFGNFQFSTGTNANLASQMTKREAYAMAALNGIVSQYGREGPSEEYAAYAFKYADAMIERSKK